MHKLKPLCILLCLVFVLCGCKSASEVKKSKSEEGKSTYKDGILHLLYNETDTLNPYGVTTKENTELCSLLYDPLVTVNGDFEPVYCLAESVSMNGRECTVKLKNALFSDGTAVTASDVVYSMNLAAASVTRYASQMKYIKSQTAVDSKTLLIIAAKNDPYFANILDFPVLKAGSENLKDGDNVALTPIGSGKYVFNSSEKNLTVNGNYYGQKPNISKIELINAPGKESVSHYVSTGVVSVCYSDYSNNEVLRMSGSKETVPLNNLVYLGINMQSYKLKNPYMRYALSSAIDRSQIVNDAYYGNAKAANGPFNPNWNHTQGFQTLLSTANSEITVENLKKMGYNKKDSEGYYVNYLGIRLTLSLLVNKENSAKVSVAGIIKKNLAAQGIFVSIDAVDYNTYMARLGSGAFELYLCEVHLLNNMDISEVVTPGGTSAYGVTVPVKTVTNEDGTVTETPDTSGINLTTAAALQGYYEGRYTLGDVVTAFISEMPLVPLCYRDGVIMYSPKIECNTLASATDIFININDYSFN